MRSCAYALVCVCVCYLQLRRDGKEATGLLKAQDDVASAPETTAVQAGGFEPPASAALNRVYKAIEV